METKKMTIHRGLAELKLIDARITKSIKSLEPTGLIQEGGLVNGLYERSVFEKESKSKLQSIIDLIDRKNNIKSAITKANGTTEVTVSGKKMKISDAINYKKIIDFKKNLIGRLDCSFTDSIVLQEQNNSKVDENALRLAEAALQKDNIKINDGDAVAITDPYIKKNQFLLVDPLEVEKLIGSMQREVDDFETEIDAVLSEINAITTIEI